MEKPGKSWKLIYKNSFSRPELSVTEGLERLRRMQDYSCHTESSWKQASRHVILNLLRDGVIACCGSRIKMFPKMEKL